VTGMAIRFLALGLGIGAFLSGITASAQAPEDAQSEPGDIVVLRGLDKIGARVTTIEVPVGESVKYGTLKITARYCRSNPPTEPPETRAFLEIEEVPPDREAQRIFSGWMFASSPALSALEHPVYDVWVLNCKMSAPESESGSE